MSYLGTHKTIESAQKALAEAVAASNRGEINLVAPGYEITMLLPMRAVAFKTFAPPGDAVYKVGGKFTFMKGFIEVLAQAARLSVQSVDRTDDGLDGCVSTFKVMVSGTTFEGGELLFAGTKTLDLREDSPAAKAMLGDKNNRKSLEQARAYIHEHAQTKAKLRAFREALNLRATENRDALFRPWVVASLVPYVDESKLSPGFYDAVAAHMLGLSTGLYGRPQAPAQLPPAQHVLPEIPDGDDDEPAPATQPAAAPTTSAAQSQVAQGQGGLASKEQIAELTRYHQTLGAAMFQSLKIRFLGRDVPGRDMTATQAESLLIALLAESQGEAKPEMPF